VTTIRGTTLIELLVCLLLASLVISAVAGAELALNTLMLRQQTRLDNRESVLASQHYLRFAIAHAGFLGCKSAYYRDVEWMVPLEVVADKMTVQYMSPNGAVIVDQPTDRQLLIDQRLDFTEGQAVIIENCLRIDRANIVRIDTFASQMLLTLDHAVPTFRDGSVAPFITQTFFMKANAQGQPSLYVFDHRNHELVVGVDQLQFTQRSSGVEVFLQAGGLVEVMEQEIKNK
jgi:hypothetical protein